MLSLIFAIVIWLIVPLILFALLMLPLVIISNLHQYDPRVSAMAGFGTGLTIFIAYVVSQLQLAHSTSFDIKYLPGLNPYILIPLLIGLVVGVVLLQLLSTYLQTRFIGIITLVLAASSTSALFSYYFRAGFRDIVLYATLGILIGLLLHLMFSPQSLRTIPLTLRSSIFRIPILSVLTILISVFLLINLILAIISLFQPS